MSVSPSSQPGPTVHANALEERLRTQVCVIGGGSSGIGAALAAARNSAQRENSMKCPTAPMGFPAAACCHEG